MILRRLAQNLKQPNWVAIWIEFVLLVAGVFLGIQVSNWNEAQADARLGRDYVQRLTHDLEEDSAAIDAEIAYYSAVLKSIGVADELLSAVDPDTRLLVVNAYRATEVTFIPPVRATWDQIVSSGHLGLLPPGAVESGLSQYYAFDTPQDVYAMGLESSYRQTVRRIIPLNLQRAIRAGCSDVRDKRGNVVGFVETCTFEADSAVVNDVADALRSDPAVIADLRYQYSFAVSAVLNLGGVRSTLEEARAALGAGQKAADEHSP